MTTREDRTVHALRSDLALQLARYVAGLGITQAAAGKRLGLPQPTLSKIINGRTSDLSIELLVRAAVRAELPLTLRVGIDPEEAGVFRSDSTRRMAPGQPSALAAAARKDRLDSDRRLTPAERLEAFLEHNELIAELSRSAGARRGQGHGS